MSVTDRLALLETFVRVSEAGALSRAAHAAGVSQPSISRRITSLETLTGVKLIHRTTHHLELTDEGRRLLPVARELISKWEGCLDDLRDSEPQGLLRVAAPVGLGQTRLMDEAAVFLKRYPKVQIDWRLTDQTIDVVNGEADIWIRIGEIADDRLVVKHIAKVQRLLVASPALAGSTSKWTQLPLVSLSPFYSAELNLFDRRSAEKQYRLRVALASDNIAAVKRAVLQGAGVALLPDWLVAPELKSGSLVRIAPSLKGKPADVLLAYAPERGRPLRIVKFVEQMTLFRGAKRQRKQS